MNEWSEWALAIAVFLVLGTLYRLSSAVAVIAREVEGLRKDIRDATYEGGITDPPNARQAQAVRELAEIRETLAQDAGRYRR